MVKLLICIRFLLCGLALLGLVVAPLARPTMAMPSGMMSMAGDHAAMDIPADMPCCPDKAPVSDCAKDCPLMALCTTGSVLNLPASAGLLMPLKLASLAFPANDTDLASLNHGPPPRPPKT